MRARARGRARAGAQWDARVTHTSAAIRLDGTLPEAVWLTADSIAESASGRLFISHMGAGQLVIVDVRAGRVIANLDGFPPR